MTPDERISNLEANVANIESRVDRIEDLLGKIDRLDEKLTQYMLTVAERPRCPSPGACIPLLDRVARLEQTHDNMAKTVADLIRWRAWLTGINLVISTLSLGLLSLLVNYIAKHL